MYVKTQTIFLLVFFNLSKPKVYSSGSQSPTCRISMNKSRNPLYLIILYVDPILKERLLDVDVVFMLPRFEMMKNSIEMNE